MITFVCKKIKQEDLIRCSFSLNKTECNVFLFLLGNKKEYTVSQIAESMKLERTTIQKAIKNLVNKKLVRRMQRNLSKGGYIFIYEISNKNEIKDKIKEIVCEWYRHVKTAINRL